MRQRLKAFTLIELLVVLAILMILAGLLFPVFRAAKAAALRTTCASNFHQAQLAASMYIGDYDDRMMLVNHRPGQPTNSSDDRTWVQLMLPYIKSFNMFRCPSDYSDRPADESSFDEDIVPGDVDSRYYRASMRTNLGYNYLYLSPVYRAQNSAWQANPRSTSEVSNPSRTLLFIDSVWELTLEGAPRGGGSWLVMPPCRADRRLRDSFGLGFMQVYTPTAQQGWDIRSKVPQLGFAYPWHGNHMNVVRLDGSVKHLTINDLGSGCDVDSNWDGAIRDPGAYYWDLD